ncbi:GlsB/YeaQ/YmgE family stress response membrane protein [Paracoccus sp. MBLB3053]|uniref:GlsB/YeaQ/YmgE family stress response membrane protein n=1 Tax=Paracoccus aurantius TaxID=3073814 RepID=A0ABU2HNH9_9RHOB|nr:GlsB/YeaQ/YmgE family stress response membrane protein [Paracoccus sp. MBLB3053]MDS9466582.1 GlsB/YeaQ/YmgE family stress response membrane protein [Paracoccus sp. MBLB3053]
MEGLGWIAAIIVGGFAGWIASNIMKADTGIFLNVILGIVGAVVGNAILGIVGMNAEAGSWIAQGLVGLLGAVILIWLYRAVAG